MTPRHPAARSQLDKLKALEVLSTFMKRVASSSWGGAPVTMCRLTQRKCGKVLYWEAQELFLKVRRGEQGLAPLRQCGKTL